MNVLKEADNCIHGERVQTYGKPSFAFDRTAELAQAMISPDEWASLAQGIFPASVGLKWNVSQKLIRDWNSPDNLDHLTDACGYLGIMADVRQEE